MITVKHSTAISARVRKKALQMGGALLRAYGDRGSSVKIYEDCILRAVRNGSRVVVSVLQPPPYLQIIGPVQVVMGGGRASFINALIPCASAGDYQPKAEPKAPKLLTSEGHRFPFIRGGVLLPGGDLNNTNGADRMLGASALINRVARCGYLVVARKFGDAAFDYWSPERPTTLVANSNVCSGIGLASEENGTPAEYPARLVKWPSLSIDNVFIENRLGGDWRVIPVMNDALIDASSFYADSFTFGWIALTPLALGENTTTYRVLTRVSRGINPDSPTYIYDYYGERALYWFDVLVEGELVDDVPTYTTTVSGGTLYQPLLSDNVQRRPTAPGGSGVYSPNGFCPPCVTPSGAMICATLTQTYYSVVLITAAGVAIEIDMPHDEERSDRVGYFVGGVEIEGVEYFINPLCQLGSIVVVNAATGAITIHSAPEWQPFDVERINRASQATYIGNRKAVFPVSTDFLSDISMASWNERTGEVLLVSHIASEGNAIKDGGLCFGCLQYEVGDESGEVVTPAVIVAGYSGNFGRFPLTGRLHISVDSGATWSLLSSECGASRGVGFVGNGITVTKEGAMFG